MRTLIAAVGIATALTVGAGQAGAAPLPLVDAPADQVADSGSATGSTIPTGSIIQTPAGSVILTPTGSTGLDAALWTAGFIGCVLLIPSCLHPDMHGPIS